MLPMIQPFWGNSCWKSSGRLNGEPPSLPTCFLHPMKTVQLTALVPALCYTQNHPMCSALLEHGRLLTPSVGHGERTFLSSLQAVFCEKARE